MTSPLPEPLVILPPETTVRAQLTQPAAGALETSLDLLTHGALITDVDETILNVTTDRIHHQRLEETLDESPTLPIIAELLVKGFPLCVITGNAYPQFERRFVAPLRNYLTARDDRPALHKLEVYANGAATHLTFDADGRPVGDELYNKRSLIPAEDQEAIVAVLTEVGDRLAATELHRPTLEPDYDDATWAYAYDPASGHWIGEDSGVARPIPWVTARGNGAQITLKPLPSQKHTRHPGTPDLRQYALDLVTERLRERLGPRADRYVVAPGGWSSIDVTRGISKATAVEHYLATHGLIPEEVLYLGNEFRPGGNDQPVIETIPGIQAMCVNQPIDEVFYLSNVFWGGGRGVHSAEHHLMDLLERYEAASVAVRLRPDDPLVALPVIREKLLDAYEQKIRDRRRLLDRLAPRAAAAQIDFRRELVCLLDRTLIALQEAQVASVAAA